MINYRIIAAASFLTIYGCSSNRAPLVEIVPAPSPGSALTRFFDAIEAENTESLLSLVDGGPNAQDFFTSVLESFIQLRSFESKFISVYGEESWKDFQAPLSEGEDRPDMSITKLDLSHVREKAKNWKPNDSNNGMFDLLIGIELPVIETKGGWVIDGSSVFSDEESLVRYTKTQRTLTEFIDCYRDAIGHPGISAEDIDYQMGKDLMIALLGGEITIDGQSPNPDRFKIDEIQKQNQSVHTTSASAPR